MAQHLSGTLVSPRAGMWLEMEGTSDLCGVFCPFSIHGSISPSSATWLWSRWDGHQSSLLQGSDVAQATLSRLFLIWLCQVLAVVYGIFHAAHGLYGCDAWAQRLWRVGLLAVWHAGS